MAYNFRAYDRDQAFLLPPDLRDWLPSDHLAWFVLDVVDQLDLGPFLKAYRADGHGRAAYAPRMLLAALLYATTCWHLGHVQRSNTWAEPCSPSGTRTCHTPRAARWSWCRFRSGRRGPCRPPLCSVAGRGAASAGQPEDPLG
jgi:hypothetical protein